jgi:hypothetical protein
LCIIKRDRPSGAAERALELLGTYIKMDADILTRFDVNEVVELLVARRNQFEFSQLAAAHRFMIIDGRPEMHKCQICHPLRSSEFFLEKESKASWEIPGRSNLFYTN